MSWNAHVALRSLCHSWCKKINQLSFVWWLVTINLPHLFYLPPEVLIGFRSDDWAGYDMVLISIHTLFELAVWHRTLSCWKTQSWDFRNIFRPEGRKFYFKESSKVRSFTKSPSGCETLCLVGLYMSLSNYQGDGKGWKLDSSEKMTLLQSSTVQSLL